MAKLKEIKKDSGKRTELKVFAIEVPQDIETQREITTQINGILAKYSVKIRTSKDIELTGAAKIKLPGLNQDFEIYREQGDSGELRIDSTVDTEGKIRIGGLNKPLSVYIIGTDEALLRGDNNTNVTDLLVEPGRVGIFTDKGNDFTFRLPNGSGDPSSTSTGALAVVSGKLKIFDGASWVVVGTQT